MRIFRRSQSLPLGVDLRPETVSIVAAVASGDRFDIREMQTLEVRPDEGLPDDLRVAQTLRDLVTSFSTHERRCVLAAPSSDVVTSVFRCPPGMSRSEAERAGALEADQTVPWPTSERLVALDPIPGHSDQALLSIARTSVIERLIALANAAGLRPVAIDVPSCAWRRAVVEVDALLDCSSDRACLIVFGQFVGTSSTFAPRLLDERLAALVRTALGEARRDGFADVQRLAVIGPRLRYESLQELLAIDGYHVSPVTIGTVEMPSWAFAYGLASWAVAPRGLKAA